VPTPPDRHEGSGVENALVKPAVVNAGSMGSNDATIHPERVGAAADSTDCRSAAFSCVSVATCVCNWARIVACV
jgi:hypothetical protein